MSFAQTVANGSSGRGHSGGGVVEVDVVRQFSRVPGGRLKRTGPFSGEAFRTDLLLPALSEARRSQGEVLVKMDGAAGYPASFLEEAFGGLVRVHGFSADELSHLMKLEANTPRIQIYRDMAWSYVKEAQGTR